MFVRVRTWSGGFAAAAASCGSDDQDDELAEDEHKLSRWLERRWRLEGHARQPRARLTEEAEEAAKDGQLDSAVAFPPKCDGWGLVFAANSSSAGGAAVWLARASVEARAYEVKWRLTDSVVRHFLRREQLSLCR